MDGAVHTRASDLQLVESGIELVAGKEGPDNFLYEIPVLELLLGLRQRAPLIRGRSCYNNRTQTKEALRDHTIVVAFFAFAVELGY